MIGLIGLAGLCPLIAAELAVTHSEAARELTGSDAVRDLHLEGLLTWVSPGGGGLVVQDDSGSVRLERSEQELTGVCAGHGGGLGESRMDLRAAPQFTD